MIFYVDFDNTIVEQEGRDYTDTTSPFVFMPYARVGLYALRAAGHDLVLWSARANRALLYNPELDPLVRRGVVPGEGPLWEKIRAINWARYQHMLDFVAQELPDVFAAIDDGAAGKPVCDRFIDDKMGDVDWVEIIQTYGSHDGPVLHGAVQDIGESNSLM